MVKVFFECLNGDVTTEGYCENPLLSILLDFPPDEYDLSRVWAVEYSVEPNLEGADGTTNIAVCESKEECDEFLENLKEDVRDEYREDYKECCEEKLYSEYEKENCENKDYWECDEHFQKALKEDDKWKKKFEECVEDGLDNVEISVLWSGPLADLVARLEEEEEDSEEEEEEEEDDEDCYVEDCDW